MRHGMSIWGFSWRRFGTGSVEPPRTRVKELMSNSTHTHTHTHTHTQITSTSTLQEVLPGILQDVLPPILQEVLPGILQEVLQDVVLPEVSGAIFSFLF